LLNNNLSFIKLTPTQTRDDKKSKPIYSTDRLNPKITQSIISQPQDSEKEKIQTWTNHESNYQRTTREMKSESYERTTRDIESGPVMKSAKVVESDSQSVEFLCQSYTDISISSDEEERKEHKVERSKAHLRPGRLKTHG